MAIPVALDTTDRLLTIGETALILGLTVSTLNQWRSNGRYDLPFVRVGRRIKYRHRDVVSWIQKRTESGIERRTARTEA